MAFPIMETFHAVVSQYNVWAIYGSLRRWFDTPVTVTYDQDRWDSWEELHKQTSNTHWTLHPVYEPVVEEFKCRVLPSVSVRKYEAYVIGKLFLKCILEENIRKMPLLCSNYKETEVFLECMKLLQTQKLSIPRIKVLFWSLFFNNVTHLEKSPSLFDVVYMLSNVKTQKPKVRTKKLLPYVRYINTLNIHSDEETMIEVVKQNFHSEDIIELDKFQVICHNLHDLSLRYKKKATQNNLKEIMLEFDHKSVCNGINKLYGNVLMLVLFGQKEENLAYYKTLYPDLVVISQCLSIH